MLNRDSKQKPLFCKGGEKEMGSKKLSKIWMLFIAFFMVFSLNYNAMAATQTSHTVKSGETLFAISKKYNVSVDTIIKLNALKNDSIKVGQVLKLTDNSSYTVKSGDTLFGIAQKFDVTIDAIKTANNMKTTDVKVGQQLVIPSGNENTDNDSITTVGKGKTVYVSEGGAKAYKTKSKTAAYYHTFVKGETVIVNYIGSLWYEGTIKDENGNTQKVYFHEDNVQGSTPLVLKDVYASKGGAKAYKMKSKTGGYHKQFAMADVVKVTYIGNYWYIGYIKDASGNNISAFYHEDEVQGTKPTTTTAPPKEEVKATVTAVVKVTGTLNIRSGAGTNYGIVGSLNNGTKVEILKESGKWANIKYNTTKTGWVSLDYLTNKTVVKTPASGTTPEKKPETPSTPTVKKATVKASGGLNVRVGAGTTFGIVGLLSNGTTVDVIKESNGWVNIQYGKLTGWVNKDYIAYTTNGGSTTSPATTTLKGKIIVLDPGHGGSDSGAVGIDKTTYEKTLALNYALDMKKELETYGATVYMTRTTDLTCLGVWNMDTNQDLKCRTDFAKTKNADIFISVHFNSAYGATGTETYYNESSVLGTANPYPEKSKLLAESVHKHYRPAVNLPDRGVKNANYYVNRMAKMPSILLEIGFVSSYNDLGRVSDASVQKAVAKAVAKGVEEYFTKTK